MGSYTRAGPLGQQRNGDPVTDSPASRQKANGRILGCTSVLGRDVPFPLRCLS